MIFFKKSLKIMGLFEKVIPKGVKNE